MEHSAPAESTSDLVDLLIEGARYGDLIDIQSALRQGVSVDAQDEQGRTGAGCSLKVSSLLVQPSLWLKSVKLPKYCVTLDQC